MRQPRLLTPEPFDQQIPSWSRDGRWVYFTSNRSGRYEVYRVPREGGEGVQITSNAGGTPTESRDGKILYYMRSGLMARDLASNKERQVLGPVAAYYMLENGIYYLIRFGRLGSFGFELRFLDFTTGKDEVLLHRSDLISSLGLTVSPDGSSSPRN